MASNAQILKTFGKQMEEFMEDMLVIFPNDNVILRGKMYFEMMKKANPRFIIRIWKNFFTITSIPFQSTLYFYVLFFTLKIYWFGLWIVGHSSIKLIGFQFKFFSKSKPD